MKEEGNATVSILGNSFDHESSVSLTAKDNISIINKITDENGEVSYGTAVRVQNGVNADETSKVSKFEASGKEITILGDVEAKKDTSVVIGNQDSKVMLTGAVLDENDFASTGTGVILNMGEGSVWNVTGDSRVSSFTGNGTVMMTASQTTGGAWSIDSSLIIGTVTSGNLNLGFNDLTADDINANEFKTMMSESGKIEVGTASVTAIVNEGDIMGEMTYTDGVVAEKDNTKLSAFSSVNATNLLQWRHEMNDLTKRMGELRISPEGVGTWARLYGSEQEYGNTGTETKNTSIQVGADYDVGAGWKVGAAFSYTDSSSSMNNGSADGDMFGLAVYGAWFNDDGQFVDLIAKYSRLSTDFTAGDMTGSYDNNAFSVSAEYGWHFKFNDLAFVEPQAELTYGQVLGDDFTMGNQVRIEQDDVDSLIGRLGVRGGFYFPENKGTIYARASVLHDFDGESSFTATKGESATYTEDMGGTWYEFGIGANFNLTDTTYTYVDLEKSTGGEVKENWRWNVGLRHVW